MFNRLDLLKESDVIVDEIANNLFRNLSHHMRTNHRLKSTMEFVKVLQNYPVIGTVISNYSLLPQVLKSDTGGFLSSFDLENFEHY